MNRSLLIAIGLTVAVLLWIFSGALSSPSNEESDQLGETPSSQSEEIFKVTISEMKAEKVDDIITLQGDLNPARSITVKAETHGRISDVKIDNGTRVAANALLMTIAPDDRQARLEQAQAELKLREAQLEAAKQLKTKKLISGNQLEEAVANVAAAKAAVKQIRVELDHTRIRAAFDGIVNDRHVELGDYVASGDPLAELIDDTHVKIVARVPQQHISKLKLGQSINAELLDGTKIVGKLDYISSHADQATRTFKVEAVAEPSANLRMGQSARVRLTLGTILAHKVSSSILSLAADGSIFINAVDENNKVVRYQAEIIKNDSDGVWLTGLPESLRLIVVGQAFVTEGQTVEVALEGDA